MKYSSIILFVAISAIAGCELAVEIPVPYDGDMVVVNGVQRIDSVWEVDLSRSMNILSPIRNIYFELPDAEAVIYHPDGSTEKLKKVDFGIYRGESKPLPGEKYKIVVNSTGFESVSAEMTMPNIVPIVDVQWDSSRVDPPRPGFPMFIYNNVPFVITINDPVGERNYYAVKVYQWQTFRNGQQGEFVDTLITEQYLRIDDPLLVSEDDYKARFSDDIFNGKTYSIKASTHLNESNQQRIIRIDLWLISLSEESFRYEETLFLQREVSGDPFAQPVPVFSNIKGGLGIFSGNAVAGRVYTRKVED